MRPEGIRLVAPVNVAEFHATKWNGEDDTPALEWLADRFGWTLKPLEGKIIITGRHHKRVPLTPGNWVVALGANGSVRVVSERVFRRDYRELD